MELNIGRLIDWDGEECLIEDEQGDVIRVTFEDFNPHDLKHVVVGSTVIITEKGYLELTSQSFSHYLEEPFDELAFMDDSDDSEEDS